MPNWVFNTLLVRGKDLDVKAFREYISQPYQIHYKKSEFDKEQDAWVDRETEPETRTGEFLFWNIISPDPELFDEYFATQPRVKSEVPVGDPDWWNAVEEKRKVSNHWYDWNITNWGTKWDATEVEVAEIEDGLRYSFQTAWSPVTELLSEKLSPLFPELTFDYEYEEEQGWGGEMTFSNGETSHSREWDIPESHADYEALGRECPCEYDTEGMFSDCPPNPDNEPSLDD